jgi:hypothetical protein
MADAGAARIAAGVSGALACLVVGMLVGGSDLPDPDIWWNVADGLFRLREGTAPPTAFFGAHGCEDPLPLVTTWASLALAQAWRAYGVWGLIAVRALSAAAVMAAIAAASRGPAWQRLAWGAGVVAAIAFRLSPRPETVSFAFLAVTVALLARATSSGSAPSSSLPPPGALALGPVAFVWGHVHPMYALGLVVVVAAALGAVVVARGTAGARAAIWCAIAFAIGAVLTPRGFAGVLDPVPERAVARTLAFAEWNPTWRAVVDGVAPDGAAGALVLVVVVVAALARLARTGASERAALAAVCAPGVVTVVFAIDAVRGLGPFCVCAGTAAGAIVDRRARHLLLGALLATAALGLAPKLARDPWLDGRGDGDFVPTRLAPLHAARALREQHISGRLYGPLHASNWFLIDNPALQPVWTGRRTYDLDCGVFLQRGRTAAGFADAAARFRPDVVLVDLVREPDLPAAVVASGYQLAWSDLRFAVFHRNARPPPDLADPEALLALENRSMSLEEAGFLFRNACHALAVVPGRPSAACALGDV